MQGFAEASRLWEKWEKPESSRRDEFPARVHEARRREAMVKVERIALGGVERTMMVVRGRKVLLDEEVAALYGVPFKQLNEQARRHAERFPEDFMFPLSVAERHELSLRYAITSTWKGPRKTVYVFTVPGVVMLSLVLREHRAIQVSIGLMRAFAEMRAMLRREPKLAHQLAALERKYDAESRVVLDAVRVLMP